MSQPDDKAKRLRFDSLAVHAGEKRPYGAVTTPIVQASTFVFDNMAQASAYVRGEIGHYEYGRYGNPTRETAETKLGALEDAEACVLFDSGMSAVTGAILALTSAGQHIVLTDDVYKKTLSFAGIDLPRFGIQTTVVPMGDYEAMEAAIVSETRLLISESPTNPYLNIADMERMATLGKRNGVLTLIDSTFGSPYNQRPTEWGIDLVLHSTTKYLGGHNDILGGAVLGDEELIGKIRTYQKTAGGIPDPNCCYLLIRGLKTLGVRMERLNSSGMRVAEHLSGHPRVRKVHYPGLPGFRYHDLARKQMKGFGAVVTFELDADLESAMRFLDALELVMIGPSLGGPESLITHPASVTYQDETRQRRLELGILDELVRLSVGLEAPEDVIADLDQALDAV